MHHHSSLAGIPLYFMSGFFIVIASSILIRKKPLIFNSRWFLLVMVVIFGSVSVEGLFLSGSAISYFPSFMFIVLIAYLYYIMKGYMVLGANGDDFQKAFIECLKEGNYEFEQTFTSIKIKEPVLEMSIAFQSWVGTGQIRMRNNENKETFIKIVDNLKTKNIKPNFIIPSLYLILGVSLLCVEFMRFQN